MLNRLPEKCLAKKVPMRIPTTTQAARMRGMYRLVLFRFMLFQINEFHFYIGAAEQVDAV